jgi:mono/diheme cytochrome c family protein
VRRRRLVALLATIVGSAAVGAAEAEGAEADALARGQALYERHGGVCHREGQTGTVVLGRRLGAERALLATRADLTVPYVRQVVRAGLMNMPRLTRVELPDSDLDALAAWLVRPRG